MAYAPMDLVNPSPGVVIWTLINFSILLLLLKDEEGTLAMGANVSFALGGAILAELLLRERIRTEPGTGNEAPFLSWATNIARRERQGKTRLENQAGELLQRFAFPDGFGAFDVIQHFR